MARILVTSGPTRQYLDPVRFISNASSGRMGCSIAEAAIESGHQVVIVSGPVSVDYPTAAQRIDVMTTEEMLDACLAEFPSCDGVIGVAAPCDYRPTSRSDHKIRKNGQPLVLELVETPDVVATLGMQKRADQWVVGFALETEDAHFRAVTKLHRKCCDLVVLNGPSAIDCESNTVEIIDGTGNVVAALSGAKPQVARDIFREIQQRLVCRNG